MLRILTVSLFLLLILFGNSYATTFSKPLYVNSVSEYRNNNTVIVTHILVSRNITQALGNYITKQYSTIPRVYSIEIVGNSSISIAYEPSVHRSVHNLLMQIFRYHYNDAVYYVVR